MRLKIEGYSTSGGRKSWFKSIDSVDLTKTNGYAFDGDFLLANTEVELPVGAVVIECVPTGSIKYSGKEGRAYVVDEKEENGLRLELEGYDWRKEFLSFRDSVAELVNNSEVNPLAEFSDEDLLAELESRGIAIGLRS
jgi:hypothetical protein